MNAEQLRASILQEAIQGKLVPQLDSEGVVEQVGDVPEEVPFEIPDSWKWIRLKDITSEIGDGLHGTPKYVLDGDCFFINGNNLNEGSISINEKTKKVSDQTYKENKAPLSEHTILVSINGTIGNVAYFNNERVMLGKSACYINVKDILSKYYLGLIVKSEYFKTFVREKSTGTTIRNLGLKAIRNWHIPVPPLEEQKRIVAKIEELLPLVKDYGKSYDHLQKINAELPEKLRASILQEAIQGKLVPQLDSEGVVEQVGEAPEEVPFEIPSTWKWVQLKVIGKIVGGGTPKTSVFEYWGNEISWITPADLGKNSSKWIQKGSKSITQKGLNESSARLMPAGSVVYSSRAPIGHIAIASRELCTNQGCKSFVPNTEIISTEWAYYMLIARTKDIQSRASGTTFKEISGKGIGETWISLPPLKEQKRIVAKVEELLKQVDALKV